jgi:diguanylate cyclase (GGDEF)-like protein/PAS domain S-box-containing protein
MSATKPARWEMLVSSMLDGFFVVEDRHFVYANESCARLLGVDHPDELLGRNVFDFVAESERERVRGIYQRRIEGQDAPRHYETRIRCADGSGETSVWLEVSELDRSSPEGALVLAATLRDISELKHLREELEDTRLQLNIILENMSDVIYRTDMDGRVTLISKNVEMLLGYSQREMLGTRLADYYWTPEERQRIVEAITANRGKITNVEAVLRRKDGSPVWISTNAYVRLEEESGEPVSIEGIARDVTRQKELELKLEKLALTDSLTGLPNRRALMDELHQRFVQARDSDGRLSVIYLDANDFKSVNDRYGHMVGDNLLRHLGQVLAAHVSGNQMFGRLSGDEFLYILPGFDRDQAECLARQILADVLLRPMPLQEQQICLSLAIGISSLTGEDAAEYSLLARADQAMYLSKGRAEGYEVL